MGDVDMKKQIAIEFVNKILVNIGKDPIKELTDFVDIDRDLIIKEENKVIVDEMTPTIIKHFDKRKLGYYNRTKVQNIIMTYLRGMCNELNYEFNYKTDEKYGVIDGKQFRRTMYAYSIKKK